jgi:hypothetical protein
VAEEGNRTESLGSKSDILAFFGPVVELVRVSCEVWSISIYPTESSIVSISQDLGYTTDPAGFGGWVSNKNIILLRLLRS